MDIRALTPADEATLEAFLVEHRDSSTLPDMVQLGGIYTPPELRGRGFAKVAVAGSLLAAQERGASRAVLFTNNSSAVRAYEALGFRLVGDYSVVLFKS